MAPKSAWVRRAQKLGVVQSGEVHRKGGKLRYIHLQQPAEQNSGCPTHDIVILSHPISRKGKYFFTDSCRAKTYLEHGYSVLAFDYNGFGESDQIDLFYWQDVVAIIEHVKAQFPDRRITLHGASFGAFHIIRALDSLPKNASVILENVNKSLFDYWKKWPAAGLLVRLLEVLQLRSIRDMNVQKVLRRFERGDLHIQFIACEHDDITTLTEMRELYSTLTSNNKSFTVIEGAGHLAAPTKNHSLYQTALLSKGRPSC